MKSILLFVIILAMIQVFVSLPSLAMIQDQALVASKHYLVETKEKPGDGLGRVTHFVPNLLLVHIIIHLLTVTLPPYCSSY